jgi:hypothetical protein
MSLYEVLAVAGLIGAGGYAYYLFRKDTQPRGPGPQTGANDVPANSLMFARTPQSREGAAGKADKPD